jgi:hypothetical protein
MSFEMFGVAIIVDRDIHAMAPFKAERPTLFGLVRPSAHIISVGQYRTSRSPLEILSRMKKYQHLMCFVHFELENDLLTLRCIVD